MRKLMATVLVMIAVFTAGLFVATGKASADSCTDGYAIMKCGATSAPNFINKARANASGDLNNIYSDFGLVPAEYSKFATTAKHGTIYDDGRIVVGGVTVGRSTMNISRTHDSKFTQQVNIGGKSYWGGTFGSTYHANTADVMVMFNDQGVMQFAIISDCGNPQRITPNKPVYSCDNLVRTPVAGKDNTYTFTTQARASQGAEVVKAVYTFSDGTTRTVNSLTAPVQHAFTKSGTVRVTVYVKVPGGNVVTATGADCVRQITVKETPPPTPPPTPTPPAPNPTMQCVRLDVTPIDTAKRMYRFTAIASHSKELIVSGANFDFGDGVVMNNVQPNGDQVVIDHGFSKAGTYNIQATVNFSDGTTVVGSSTCGATVTPTDVIEYCKPGIPVGDARCEEQLVATGPGAVIGVVGISGMLAGAGHYFIRRRLV